MQKVMKAFTFLVVCFLAAFVHAEPLKRKILALHAGSESNDLAFHPLHLYAELPLNHLGFVLHYHDIEKGFPNPSDIAQSAGVVTWFLNGRLKDPLAYIKWASSVIESGVKFLILGNIGIEENLSSQSTSLSQLNILLNSLGIDRKDVWVNPHQIETFSFDSEQIVNYERNFDRMTKGFHIQNLTASKGRSLVYVTLKDGLTSDLVVITPKGGIATEGYFLFLSEEQNIVSDKEEGIQKGSRTISQWYLDPFRFFKDIFDADSSPKPDVTTLCGNRLYFNHIDGPGWNRPTEIELYKKSKPSSLEVVYREIIEPHPELPLTLGPIMAELDPRWGGSKNAQEFAKKIFAQSHVEAASNSYTYPEDTKYFEHTPSLEDEKKDVVRGITRRLFTQNPFDYTQEFEGSINFLTPLLPDKKEVTTYLWPGNALPSRKDIEQVESLKRDNLNGGSNRFDAEYPSYSSLSPYARQNGPYLQIYAAGNNENSYTYGWKERFFGMKLLTRTLINTDRPLRVKPINLYYTALCGLKRSSMSGIQEVIDYIGHAEIIPVFASDYCKIVKGFYSSTFEPLSPLSWSIKNRGNLQTIRFDNASLLKLDLTKSQGVIGGKHIQGSLYIALDSAHENPVITLQETSQIELPFTSPLPYLVDAHWHVSNWKFDTHKLSFNLNGFGSGFLTLYLPEESTYQIEIDGNSQKISTKEHLFKIWLDFPSKIEKTVKVEKYEKKEISS